MSNEIRLNCMAEMNAILYDFDNLSKCSMLTVLNKRSFSVNIRNCDTALLLVQQQIHITHLMKIMAAL